MTRKGLKKGDQIQGLNRRKILLRGRNPRPPPKRGGGGSLTKGSGGPSKSCHRWTRILKPERVGENAKSGGMAASKKRKYYYKKGPAFICGKLGGRTSNSKRPVVTWSESSEPRDKRKQNETKTRGTVTGEGGGSTR